jgi:suppressor of fused
MTDPDDMVDTDDAPGWDAIDAALRRIYGDTEPAHWGSILKWRLGGPDPLDGISAYARTDPVPHWHYVSYGMSELYEKEGSDPDLSGWGFEFTFRLARAATDTKPPVWPANLLQNLGRYVFNSGNWFEAGHHLDANGPIAADRADCRLTAVGFVLDPELGEIATPSGRVEFLQVTGLTEDEYAAGQEWNTLSLLGTLEPRMPLFVTDVGRRSLLDDPAVAAAVREGAAREGSSTGSLYVGAAGCVVEGERTRLRFGALAAPLIGRMLAARLGFGRGLVVTAPDGGITFVSGADFAVTVGDTTTVVAVPEAALSELVDALRPRAGRYPVPAVPGLEVEIEPTAMRDAHGNETGEVVG